MSNFRQTIAVLLIVLGLGIIALNLPTIVGAEKIASAADTFSTYRVGLDSPATNAFAVTPHDTNALTNDTRAIYVGGAGTIVLVTTGGDTVTLTGALVGTVYQIRANIIKSTGTTATNIVALY